MKCVKGYSGRRVVVCLGAGETDPRKSDQERASGSGHLAPDGLVRAGSSASEGLAGRLGLTLGHLGRVGSRLSYKLLDRAANLLANRRLVGDGGRVRAGAAREKERGLAVSSRTGGGGDGGRRREEERRREGDEEGEREGRARTGASRPSVPSRASASCRDRGPSRSCCEQRGGVKSQQSCQGEG